MNQKQIADIVGFSQSWVSHLLRKHKVQKRELRSTPEDMARGIAKNLETKRAAKERAAEKLSPPPPSEPGLVSVAEAADLLRCEVEHVRVITRFFQIAPLEDGSYRKDLIEFISLQRDLARNLDRLREITATLFESHSEQVKRKYGLQI